MLPKAAFNADLIAVALRSGLWRTCRCAMAFAIASGVATRRREFSYGGYCRFYRFGTGRDQGFHRRTHRRICGHTVCRYLQFKYGPGKFGHLHDHGMG